MAHRKLARVSLAKVALAPALIAAAVLLPLPLPARGADGANAPPTVSVKVLDALAPPGGVVQFLATLTEPKPLIQSIITLTYDPLGPVLGVALYDPSGAVSDASGTAVVRSGRVVVSAVSPSALFGTFAGVPILSMAIGVPLDAPVGTRGALAIDPSGSLWLAPGGAPYHQVIKNATFEIGGTISITDVFPGGGLLPAGATVVVRGVGFQRGAIVEIDGVPVAATTFVTDKELDVTIAAAADLFGRAVRVLNPDLTRARYFAYLRAAWLAPTTRALLAATDPIFAQQTYTGAWFPNVAAAGQFLGVALQNPNAGPADAAVELRSPAGALVASAALTLPPRTRISRELSELFGMPPPASGFFVVRSSVPVQILGVVGDDAAGTVAPLLPALAFP